MKIEDRIIFEDNHLIVCNKLPGEIVQGDKTGDQPLSDIVKEYIKVKYEKPGDVFLGTVHRLDRPTSGIVLFARTSKALSRMNELFKSRTIEKTYFAITQNAPNKLSATLRNYLRKNEKQNKSYVVDSEVEGSKLAELQYEIVAEADRYYLWKVNPLTGRHHQIRSQLSTLGCPIKGDVKYGYPKGNKNRSIDLHAFQLSFVHPVTKTATIISAPFPIDNLWNYFGDAMQIGR